MSVAQPGVTLLKCRAGSCHRRERVAPSPGGVLRPLVLSLSGGGTGNDYYDLSFVFCLEGPLWSNFTKAPTLFACLI